MRGSGRKGTGIAQNVLIQLIVFIMIALVIAVPFFSSVAQMEFYDQTVYATDNALLLESMMSARNGVVTWTYPLSELTYTIGLRDDAVLQIGAVRMKRLSGVTRRLLIDNATKIIPARFTPLVYELEKTPASITAKPVSFTTACPPAIDIPDWNKKTASARGEPFSAHILDAVFASQGITTAYTKDSWQQGATLGLAAEFSENTTIEQSGEPLMDRLSCLLVREMQARGLPTQILRENRSLPQNTLVVQFPEKQYVQMRPALVCAYKKLFTEEAVDGCI